MGQVVKYIVDHCSLTAGLILRPWAAWRAGFLRLRLAVMVAIPVAVFLTCSGADRQAPGAKESLTVRDIHIVQQPVVDSPPTTRAPAGRASPGSTQVNTPSYRPKPQPPVDHPGAPAAPTPGEPEMDASPPSADPGLQPPPGAGEQLQLKPLREVPGAGRRVALTFDDGPVPGWTELYLHALDTAGVSATFFMVGRQAEAHPALVKAVQAGGHQVASHSWRHADLSKAAQEEIEEDLQRAAVVLQNITGQPVKYFRPPYGAVGPNLIAAAANLELQMVTWNVDPRDWSRPPAEVIVQLVMSHVSDGSIILLHESLPGTLAALPVLIHKLRNQGYELVTISDLIASSLAAADR
ncbi:polysaccharide deacetylase family protein [Moorellaceae bacterium AZ2]